MKSNKKSIIFLTIIAIVIMGAIILAIYFGINSNNRNFNIKLSGYYYENVEKNSFGQNIYYFENDGTCFIKQKSLTSSLSTLTISEKYDHCTYKIKNNDLILNIYDNNYYETMVETKTYTIETIDDGIKLNGVEYLNQNYDHINDFEEHFLENYSLACASNVAKQYGVSNNCTKWEKISDGFYNYSCGITIRTIVDENGISYDTYNSTSSQFSDKNYCYKILRKNEKEINVSDNIITKSVPVKIIPTGDINSEYVIDSIKPNIDQVYITGYQYRLEGIEFFPIYVDVNNLSSNNEFKIKLNKPIYSKSIDLDEISVNVAIDKRKTKEIILSGDDLYNINVKNVYKGLRAFINEQLKQIKIKINGTENNLTKIKSVNVYIDLSNYNIPGVYMVDLKADIDETIYSYSIEPSKIKIKIT